MTEKFKFPADPRNEDYGVNEELTRDENYAEVAYYQIVATLAKLGFSISQESKILEIGVGKVLLLKELHKRGYDAVGIDSRPRGNSEMSVAAARIEQLPFENETFDFLISNGVFDSSVYENQDQKIMAQEISRVLKPGGVYVSMMDNPDTNKISSGSLKPLTGGGYESCHIYQKAKN